MGVEGDLFARPMGLAVRMRVWLGVAGAVRLSAGAALAGGDRALPPVGALGAILAVLVLAGAVLLVVAQRRSLRLRAERDRAAAALAERDAVLGAVPAALYRWDHRDGTESFAAGPIAALAEVNGRRLPDLLARLEPKDAAALEAAVAQPRADGTGFRMPLPPVAGPAALDASGRRPAAGDRTPVGDLRWLLHPP